MERDAGIEPASPPWPVKLRKMERPAGIEPASSPWEGDIEPLNYGRNLRAKVRRHSTTELIPRVTFKIIFQSSL